MIDGKNYIGGNWVQGSGAAFTSESPANDQTIWQGFNATGDEVNGAFDVAHEAYLNWRKTPLADRMKILRAYSKIIEDNKDKLAKVISDETGKVLWDAASEVAAVIGKVEHSIRAYEERTPTNEGTLGALRTRLTHKPHGVMGVIGPYNFPCHLANGHMVPALLAGNTIVFKPSSWTPWSAEMMIGFMAEAGMPKGVVNLVQGGRDVGQAILNHPNLKGLLFTGGVPAGKLFAKTLVERLDVVVALELGGNNPLIVWDAEDLTAAAITTIQSAYISAGQRCTCARRLIVPDNDYGKKVMTTLTEAIKGVEVGLPDADPQPFMGSLISEGAAQAALDRQAELEGQGGVVLARGERLALGPAFVSPSLIDVTDVADRSDEECFGPLLQVIRVKDFDAAIAEANDTNFGLAAGVLTDNKALYEQFYTEIEAGVVNWNQPLPGASSAAPFGGLKDSGNHRPAAYYAADYSAWPMASLENPENKLTRPALPKGLKV